MRVTGVKRGKTSASKTRLVFVCHWLRIFWREFCSPITEPSKAKPKQTRITFDTRLKTAVRKH